MQVSVYRNLSKIGPHLKISPCTPSVLDEVVTKGAFFAEVQVHSPIYICLNTCYPGSTHCARGGTNKRKLIPIAVV